MTKNWKLLGMLVAALLMAGVATGCSDDVMDAEEYDTVYDIKYYDKLPHRGEEQGYWYDSRFIELVPQSKPPYTLYVKLYDEKGRKAFEGIRNRKDVVLEVSSLEPDEYTVVSTKYFECPHFYVSTSYQSAQSSREGYDLFILPYITIKMQDGENADAIGEKYKVDLVYDETRYGIAHFDCTLRTSREVLRLASEIYQRDDVKWAEADMLGGIYLTNTK